MNHATTPIQEYAQGRCRLCPRMCGADRRTGAFRPTPPNDTGRPAPSTGFCGCGGIIVAARAALHHWEEPCISGVNGSGTIFFSGCTLRCCFCQNYRFSHSFFTLLSF